MTGEMTIGQIREGFSKLGIQVADMELLIEFIENTGTCPACGNPLKIKEPDFWEHGSVG